MTEKGGNDGKEGPSPLPTAAVAAAGAPGFAVLIREANEGGLARGSFPPRRLVP